MTYSDIRDAKNLALTHSSQEATRGFPQHFELKKKKKKRGSQEI